jgi:hypothetical protein
MRPPPFVSPYLQPMNKYPQPNTPNEVEGQILLDGVNEVIPDYYEEDMFEQLDALINSDDLDGKEES